MLIGLAIRDVVLIERLDLAFAGGLCALTGETGAGKSILLDALGLSLGARSDATLVRHGSDSASVTAEFEVPPDHQAIAVLDEQDLPGGETLLLRRTLTRDGRSRAFVNDQPVGAALLRRIGETLVEVHGQFDTAGLLNPRTHRDSLDAFGGLPSDVERVTAAWRAWRQVEEARLEADAKAAQARAEEDYLRHAVAEFDALDPQPSEEEQLADRRAMLMHREKLIEAINGSLAQLSGDTSAEGSLSGAQRLLDRVADKAAGRLAPTLESIDRALSETAEATAQLQSLSADIDLDVGELESLEERLFLLRATARKFGTDVDGLAALRDELAEKLSLIEGDGDLLSRLAKSAELAKAAYVQAADALSAARTRAAGELDAAIAAELPPLKLEKARFLTQIAPLSEGEWAPTGRDRVTFLVSTNPGAPPGPLNRVASGGELARFMLALKVVMARGGSAPTLIFDEVDSGISGAVAAAVGERLGRLSEEVQVLVVTHSPQVAARAGHHWRVAKASSGDHVATTVAALRNDERREEIARMLSGATITDQARAAADSLIAAQPA